MPALVLSLVALLVPAAFADRVRERPGVAAFLDGVVVAAIGGLVALDVLPGAADAAGGWAISALAVGLVAPSLAERLGIGGHRVHDVGVVAGQAVLAVHAVIDGIALATAEEVGVGLATAVVLHQVPVGLAVWASVAAQFGQRAAWVSLVSMACLTAAGFVAGDRAIAAADPLVVGLAAGAAAGTLLHVVGHGPLPGSAGRPRLAGAGAIVAVVAVLAMGRFHDDGAVIPFLKTWRHVAPAALLALGIAALARSPRVAPLAAALLAIPLAGDRLAAVLLVALAAVAPLSLPARGAPLPRLVAGLLAGVAVAPAAGDLSFLDWPFEVVPGPVALAAAAGLLIAEGPFLTVPLAASLWPHLGTGGVVAFVVAGLSTRLGRAGTGVLALVLGVAVDTFLPDPGSPLRAPGSLATAAALALAGLAGVALLRDGPRAWLDRVGPDAHPHPHPETP